MWVTRLSWKNQLSLTHWLIAFCAGNILSFYANVFTGVLAPVMVIYLIAIGNSRKIMGEHKLGWLTNFFLALTALVLVAGSVLFFYGLATGQGGS